MFNFKLLKTHIPPRKFVKGDTGKQALKHICLQFLQFLSNFNETLSISFFFRGRLNRALRSDLTPLHSAHFTTAQRALCTDFPTFLLVTQKEIEKTFLVTKYPKEEIGGWFSSSYLALLFCAAFIVLKIEKETLNLSHFSVITDYF